MIKVQCGTCGQTLEAPNELSGKKATCPTCKSPIIVPAPVAKPQAVNQVGAAAATVASGSTSNYPISSFGSVPPTVPPNVPQYSQTVPPPNTYGNADDYRLGIAAVMSFFLPSLGQIFKRQITRAFMIQGAIALLMILSVVLNVVYKMLELTGNQVAPLALIAVAIGTWQIYDASR